MQHATTRSHALEKCTAIDAISSYNDRRRMCICTPPQETGLMCRASQQQSYGSVCEGMHNEDDESFKAVSQMRVAGLRLKGSQSVFKANQSWKAGQAHIDTATCLQGQGMGGYFGMGVTGCVLEHVAPPSCCFMMSTVASASRSPVAMMAMFSGLYQRS